MKLHEAKPFLKWVGGKRSIIPFLLDRMPRVYNQYNELFVGGGALFFAVQPSVAYLCDINSHLVSTYNAVKDNIEPLILLVNKFNKQHCKEQYLDLRSKLSETNNPVEIAAIMIYLNKTCFNGLYRVNKSGGFNVPMGNYSKPPTLDESVIRADSLALRGVTISCADFSQTGIRKDSFYYLDPPYHKTFSNYSSSGFGEDRHRDLASFCHRIHDAGGYFMLSNSNTDFVKSLYDRYNIEQVSASRSISCKGNQRGKESELLIRNYDC